MPPRAGIPAIGQFVWLGAKLPAVAYVAIRRAQDHGRLPLVRLHAADPALGDDPLVQELLQRPGFELAVTPQPAAPGLGPDVDAALLALLALLDKLERPAARADLLRLLILWREGGIYLDADALALRDLRPLCAPTAAAGFAGLERVCLPARVVHSLNPAAWLRAGVLMALRDAVGRLRGAPQRFEAVAGLYHLACNNAVLGATAGHPMLADLLRAAAALPTSRALKLYELGPRLLETVTNNRSSATFELHPPTSFYALSPEICWQYVRDDPDKTLEAWLGAQPWTVHLYDSVLTRRLGQPLDTAWLLRNRGQTWLSRAADAYLGDLGRLAP